MTLIRIGCFDSYESLVLANHLASLLLKGGLDTKILSLKVEGQWETMIRGLETADFDLFIWKKSEIKNLSGRALSLGDLDFEHNGEKISLEAICCKELRTSSRITLTEIIGSKALE